MAPNYGVPDEGVGLVWGGAEEGEGVGEVAGGGEGAELDELAEGEEGVVEAGFDDLGVDLLEGVDVVALREECEGWVVLEESVGRV